MSYLSGNGIIRFAHEEEPYSNLSFSTYNKQGELKKLVVINTLENAQTQRQNKNIQRHSFLYLYHIGSLFYFLG